MDRRWHPTSFSLPSARLRDYKLTPVWVSLGISGSTSAIITQRTFGEDGVVKELARFLLQNAQIDFSGEITIEQVRQYLREDDSREARALLAKLIEDKGVDDMLVTLADCLKEYIPEGVSEDVIRQQLSMYSES